MIPEDPLKRQASVVGVWQVSYYKSTKIDSSDWEGEDIISKVSENKNVHKYCRRHGK